MKKWTDYTPIEAFEIDLSEHPEIEAPLNEQGERCPWPWDPEQHLGKPIGQYHCPYCGAMVIAGMRHIDYREEQTEEMMAEGEQVMIIERDC